MARRQGISSLAGLERQLAALDSQRHTIIGQIKSALERLTGGFAAPMAGLGLATRNGSGGGRRKGYRVSAATRAKMRAAWARRKAANGTGANTARPKNRPARRQGRRPLSAEARARIVAAQKQRWAEYRRRKDAAA
jgi:hypothetical protein